MAGDEHAAFRTTAFDGGLTVGQRISHVETAVVGLSNRVDLLEGWRDELPLKPARLTATDCQPNWHGPRRYCRHGPPR